MMCLDQFMLKKKGKIKGNKTPFFQSVADGYEEVTSIYPKSKILCTFGFY